MAQVPSHGLWRWVNPGSSFSCDSACRQSLQLTICTPCRRPLQHQGTRRHHDHGSDRLDHRCFHRNDRCSRPVSRTLLRSRTSIHAHVPFFTCHSYYGQKLNAGIAILQTWAAQLIGYGWAGILRTTLVYPSYALFPANLPTMTLLQSMHMGGMFNKKRMRL